MSATVLKTKPNNVVAFNAQAAALKSKKNMNFPFQYKKPAAVKMLRKIIHRLKRKKGEYLEFSIEDRLNDLFTNPKWQSHLKALTKKQQAYLRKHRIKFAYVKLRDIFIDDDIQRQLDVAHVIKIGNIKKFQVPFMSAIQGTKSSDGKFHATNAQHTVVYEAALAYHGLWEDYVGDWRDLEVPFLYIETDDRSLARRSFQVLNGKNSLPISPYDWHKLEVLCYRVDGNTDSENVQSAKLQSICEENGFEPISEFDEENAGHPKAITHISAMRKYKDKPEHWEFILKCHAKYWPNYQLHGMEIDFYGFMYEYFKKKMNVDVYSTKFEKDFLNPVHGMIQSLFTSPENLSNESANTFKRWWSTTWQLSLDEAQNSVEAQGSFVLILKMYRLANGSHALPDIVDLYESVIGGDLTKHLPSNIKKIFKI